MARLWRAWRRGFVLGGGTGAIYMLYAYRRARMWPHDPRLRPYYAWLRGEQAQNPFEE